MENGRVVNSVSVDGLIITTVWDANLVNPLELHITPDPNPQTLRLVTKGIPDRVIHRLSLQSMCPDSMRTLGDLRAVGCWLEGHKPKPRKRPDELFLAHVTLFFTLAIQTGEKGVTSVLANYAAVRPTMARKWIEEARKRGMLTDNASKSSAGRAYGILTERARNILGSQSQLPEDEAA